MVARAASGQGYEVEAMRSVLTHPATSGLRNIATRTQLGDRSSEAALESLGFMEEGLLRVHILRDGERRDGRVFRLLL